jgi:hypothetical protein
MMLWKIYRNRGKGLVSYKIKTHIPAGVGEDKIASDLSSEISQLMTQENIIDQVKVFEHLKDKIISTKKSRDQTQKSDTKPNGQKKLNPNPTYQDYSDVNLEISGKETPKGFVSSEYA